MPAPDRITSYVLLILLAMVILTGIVSYFVIASTSFSLLANGLIIVLILCFWGFVAERTLNLYSNKLMHHLNEVDDDDSQDDSQE